MVVPPGQSLEMCAKPAIRHRQRVKKSEPLPTRNRRMDAVLFVVTLSQRLRMDASATKWSYRLSATYLLPRWSK